MGTLFLMHGMLKLWSSEINFNLKKTLPYRKRKKETKKMKNPIK